MNSINRYGVVLLFLVPLTGCSTVLVDNSDTVGTYSWLNNKVQATFDQDIKTVYEAGRKTLEDLEIPIADAEQDALAAKVVGKDVEEDMITIKMKSKDEGKTAVSIQVGHFGNKDKAIRVYRALNRNL